MFDLIKIGALSLLMSISLTSYAQPANDDPCGAIELFPSTTCSFVNYNNNGATITSSPYYIANMYTNSIIADADVWFKIVVPASGVLTIEAQAGTLTDANMALYSGSSCSGTLTLLNCNERTSTPAGAGSGTNEMPIIAQNNLTPLSTVWVRIGNIYGDIGSFGICVTSPNDLPTPGGNPSASEDCLNASPVCDLKGYAGTTVGYTSSYTLNSSQTACVGGWCDLYNALPSGTALQNDSWIKFTPSATSINFNVWVTFSQKGQGFQILVLKAPNCGSANVQFNPTIWTPARVPHGSVNVVFSGLTIGQEYYLIFDGAYSDQSDFFINTPPDGGGFAVTTAVSPLTSEICLGDHVDLTCIGASGNYDWTASPNAADLNSTNIATVRATPTTTGMHSYSVTATQINTNCPSSPGIATINVKPAGVVTPISGASSVCKNSTIVLTNTTPGGTWTVSNPKLTFTVDPVTNACTITGVTPGSCDVTYSVCGTSTKTITINDLPVVSAIGNNAVTCTGSFFTPTVSATPIGGSGTWSSASPAKATIDANSGLVTGVSAGTSVITYTYVDLNNCTNTQNATVTISSSAAAIVGVSTICVGASHTFTNSTLGGSWSSSDNAIATVNSSGLVTAVAAGPVVISYTACGAPSTYNLTVNDVPVAGTIQGLGTFCLGTPITLTGNNSTVGSVDNWVSGTTSVATINATTGVVTSLTAGQTTITYSVTKNGCTSTNQQGNLIITSVAAIQGVNSVCIGNKITLTDATNGGTWSIVNGTGSASIVPNGTSCELTGVSAGQVTVKYTGCNEVTKNITVNALPVVTAIAGTLNACNGLTQVLTSTPANGVWTSDNLSVATVNSSTGLVSAIAGGTSNIKYTFTDNNGCQNSSTAIFTTNQPKPVIEDVTGANHVYCYFNLNKDTMNMTGNTGATTGLWSYIAPSTGGEATFFSTTNFNTGIKISKYGDYKFIFKELVCNNTDTLLVNFRPGAYAYVDSVFTVCTGTSHEFKPSFTYPEYIKSTVWSTGDITPSITVKEQGIYTLTVSTGCGNPYVSTSKLFVKLCDIESMPNVITPNGDGVNDSYVITVEDGIFKAFDIVITNRWGSVITEYSDPKAAWNGKTKNGDLVEEGVYFYSLKGETIEGKKITRQGFIHVIYE